MHAASAKQARQTKSHDPPTPIAKAPLNINHNAIKAPRNPAANYATTIRSISMPARFMPPMNCE